MANLSRPWCLLGFCWLISLPLFAQIEKAVPPPPDPPRLVNDLAGQLAPDQVASLEAKLVAFNDSSSTQIAVVTVKSLGGYEIADFALALGRSWGVGQRGKNNGILLLWCPPERKYWITIGYGVEGAVPDAVAGRVGRELLAPNFRAGNFYRGLDQATDALIGYTRGEYKAEATDQRRSNRNDAPGLPLWLIVVMVLIVIWLVSRGNRGGGNRSRGGMPFLPFTTFSGGGSRGGFGGFGGGGGGGGGFGGFGGGSFGGGGAGGSY